MVSSVTECRYGALHLCMPRAWHAPADATHLHCEAWPWSSRIGSGWQFLLPPVRNPSWGTLYLVHSSCQVEQVIAKQLPAWEKGPSPLTEDSACTAPPCPPIKANENTLWHATLDYPSGGRNHHGSKGASCSPGIRQPPAWKASCLITCTSSSDVGTDRWSPTANRTGDRAVDHRQRACLPEVPVLPTDADDTLHT